MKPCKDFGLKDGQYKAREAYEQGGKRYHLAPMTRSRIGLSVIMPQVMSRPLQ